MNEKIKNQNSKKKNQKIKKKELISKIHITLNHPKLYYF